MEETLERIKAQKSVKGYVICNNEGQVLRRHQNKTAEEAQQLSGAMEKLAKKASGVIRDLNPMDHMQYLRIRNKRREIVVARDDQFLVIVEQEWVPAERM